MRRARRQAEHERDAPRVGILCLCVTIAFGGCTARTARGPEAMPLLQEECSVMLRTDAVAGRLLREMQELRARAPAAQLRELHRIESDFSRTGDPGDRLRLALALSLLDTPLRDGPRARRLAGESLRATPEGPYQHVARIVLSILDETQRQSAVRRRLQVRWALAERERRLLEQQVEALKEIERAINSRDEAGGAR